MSFYTPNTRLATITHRQDNKIVKTSDKINHIQYKQDSEDQRQD